MIKIGITLGDINGIGPEVAMRAAYRKRWSSDTQLVMIGPFIALAEQAVAFGFPVPTRWSPGEKLPSRRVVVWDPESAENPKWNPGAIRVSAARAADGAIRAAVAGCVAGEFQAMVTAPICKEGFQKAGIDVPGHTELLAELLGVRRFAMLLMGGGLRVLLVTRHLPLKSVAGQLTRARVEETIELAAEGLPWLGAARVKIGVCGLNPHAGDGGALGDEERVVITPAIRRARRRGVDVDNVIPADVIFHKALRGEYDAVVAMFHDQGLGPLKMIAFDKGVNITLGLPIVRTSPDHGTAFDIAGQGTASATSMVEAVRLADLLARRKNPWEKGEQ